MPGKRQPIFFRWADKILFNEETGCWIWLGKLRGSRSPSKYGAITLGPRNAGWISTHRFAFEHFRRRVRAGFELDHTCHDTRCCNPWHLDEVKPTTNIRRRDKRLRAKNRLTAKQQTRPWDGWISEPEPG